MHLEDAADSIRWLAENADTYGIDKNRIKIRHFTSDSNDGTEDVIHRISGLLKKDNIETTKEFGIYYDDPKLTPLDSLRSIAGWIIEPSDTTKIKSAGSMYKIMHLPSKRYAIAEIKNRGALSAFAGSVKVYAALDRFMKENEYPPSPTMEIYDRNKTIRYLREIKE